MPDRAITLRRLEYFVTVADELHFGRSAQLLHVAQPALSRQIRQLEDDLGLRLFERTTRRVSVTPAGAAFLRHARSLLVAADGVERAAEELRTGGRGRLRLGFVDSAAYELVPRFLHRFRDERPDVEIELHTMSSDEQAGALLAGHIDVGVARAVPAGAGLAAEVVGEEPLVVAVPEHHPVAGQRSVRLRRLREWPLVGFARERSPTLHAELRVLLARHGVAYATAFEATEYSTILGLVAAGEGVALVPAGVQSFRLPGLRFVAVADRDATVGLAILSRRGEPQAIVGHALDELRATVAAGRGGSESP